MRASRLRRKPKHLYNFTGLRVEQFEQLCEAIRHRLAEQNGAASRARQRAPGGGRKAELAVEDQVLVVLLYYRLYLTQLLLGYLFNLDDSNVSRLISKLRPLLLEVLPLPAQETVLFAQAKRISSLEELLEKHPEFKEVLIDATAQEIQKPQDKQKRKDKYSGKKKRHALKSQITATSTRLILHVTRSLPGRISDIDVLRGTGVLRDLPAAIHVRVDKGYDGIDKNFPERTFHQPAKARRNKPLDFVQKCLNKTQNSVRFPVEHTLAHLKRFKLLAGLYRGPEAVYDDTFLAITGLHNFRKLDALA